MPKYRKIWISPVPKAIAPMVLKKKVAQNTLRVEGRWAQSLRFARTYHIRKRQLSLVTADSGAHRNCAAEEAEHFQPRQPLVVVRAEERLEEERDDEDSEEHEKLQHHSLLVPAHQEDGGRHDGCRGSVHGR